MVHLQVPGGCSYEMLKVCLDDAELLQLLTAAAEDFARFGTAVCQGSGKRLRSLSVCFVDTGRH